MPRKERQNNVYFDIVNFLFLDGDVPRRASYGVYISQLIRFARKKVQVGKDQEKGQSEKDSDSKNRGVKKLNQQSGTYTMKTYRKPNEQLFSQ